MVRGIYKFWKRSGYWFLNIRVYDTGEIHHFWCFHCRLRFIWLFFKRLLTKLKKKCFTMSPWIWMTTESTFSSHLFYITLTFSLLGIELSPSCALQFRAETPQNREELLLSRSRIAFSPYCFTNSQSQIPNDFNILIVLTKRIIKE